METEVIEKVESNVVVVNEQPEFVENFNEKLSVRYFVVCENLAGGELGARPYECKISGLSLASWVARACDSEPVILKVNEGEDVLPLIRPYANTSEYSVVLYASTPFVRKKHIRDLLGFVSRKHLSVCKLKKGYVFKNEYIERVNEIFSIDEYDFASEDFFEVKSLRDLEYAELVLSRRVFDFYRKNQVQFESRNVTIDATAELGYNTKIAGGATIVDGTIVGADCEVFANASISGSKIGDDVTIGQGAIIQNSVIKDGAKIEAGALICHSVVGERCTVGQGAKIMHSGIKQNVVVEMGAELVGARIAENAVVKSLAKVVMVEEPTIVLQGATIGSGAEVFDVTIKENSNILPFTKITKKQAD